MATRITSTELARKLADILNRVRYRGEAFDVVRNGEVIATLEPPVAPAPPRLTWGEFVKRWHELPKPDPEYWNDVAAAHAAQGEVPAELWP